MHIFNLLSFVIFNHIFLAYKAYLVVIPPSGQEGEMLTQQRIKADRISLHYSMHLGAFWGRRQAIFPSIYRIFSGIQHVQENRVVTNMTRTQEKVFSKLVNFAKNRMAHTVKFVANFLIIE
jgi:hypothetical protein